MGLEVREAIRRLDLKLGLEGRGVDVELSFVRGKGNEATYLWRLTDESHISGSTSGCCDDF